MRSRLEPDVTVGIDDIELVGDVLVANPSFEATAEAVQRIEKGVSYPILDVEGIEQAFRLRPFSASMESVQDIELPEFLPPDCFPIGDRTQLIAKLAMAFERRRMGLIGAWADRQGHSVPSNHRSGLGNPFGTPCIQTGFRPHAVHPGLHHSNSGSPLVLSVSSSRDGADRSSLQSQRRI